jgi:hypothetical protein
VNTLVCLSKLATLGKVGHDSQATICRNAPCGKGESRSQPRRTCRTGWPAPNLYQPVGAWTEKSQLGCHRFTRKRTSLIRFGHFLFGKVFRRGNAANCRFDFNSASCERTERFFLTQAGRQRFPQWFSKLVQQEQIRIAVGFESQAMASVLHECPAKVFRDRFSTFPDKAAWQRECLAHLRAKALSFFL